MPKPCKKILWGALQVYFSTHTFFTLVCLKSLILICTSMSLGPKIGVEGVEISFKWQTFYGTFLSHIYSKNGDVILPKNRQLLELLPLPCAKISRAAFIGTSWYEHAAIFLRAVGFRDAVRFWSDGWRFRKVLNNNHDRCIYLSSVWFSQSFS